MVTFAGVTYGRGRSGSLIRRRTIDACAIVSPSRAPNAYRPSSMLRSRGIARPAASSVASTISTHGVKRVGMQAPERAGDLTVRGQRIGEAREPEHRRVRRRDQRHGRDGGDRVLERVAQPLLLERRDHAEHRCVAVLLAERRLAVHDGLGAHGDERDPRVDDEHGERRGVHEAAQVAARDADLTCKPRRRFEAGRDHRRDAQGDDHVLERRRGPQVDGARDRVGVEEQRQPEHDDQQLDRRRPPRRASGCARSAWSRSHGCCAPRRTRRSRAS